MTNKPKFSEALLKKINQVHASASDIFKSIDPNALKLIPIKTEVKQPTSLIRRKM